MKNNKVSVEEVLEKMVDIKTHLEKISQLFDRVAGKTLTLRELKSSIEDIEPFIEDERIQLVSEKILELTKIIQLKSESY